MNAQAAQTKSTVVRAGVSEEFFLTGSFETFKKPRKEMFEVATEDGIIRTLEGTQRYLRGDFIVTGPKGEKYPVPQEAFTKLRVDNGDGTCTPKKIVKLAKLADGDGFVPDSRGGTLEFRRGEDYIVRHGPHDYGVVKRDIFLQTYEAAAESRGERARLSLSLMVSRLRQAPVRRATDAYPVPPLPSPSTLGAERRIQNTGLGDFPGQR